MLKMRIGLGMDGVCMEVRWMKIRQTRIMPPNVCYSHFDWTLTSSA